MLKMARQPDLLILKLMEKLADSDPVIRRNAAGALRLQGSRAVAAIPALATLLTDMDLRVRNEAERALDHLRLVAA
jgi:HEAT repeat protein